MKLPKELDEGMCNFLVSGARLTVGAPPTWRVEPAWVKADIAVLSAHWDPLTLSLKISRTRPGKYTYALRSRGTHLRRLDVRGAAHWNPVVLDGRQFLSGETHKHAWKDGHGAAWAYSPRDIPVLDAHPVAPDEYRLAFEAFAAECEIRLDADLGYRWVEPEVPPRRSRL